MRELRTWAFAAALLTAYIAPADAEAPVPVEAFAAANRLHSPRLSPDGAHLAITADLGDGHHALAVHRTDDMQRTALLRDLDAEQKEYMAKKEPEAPSHYFRMMKELTMLGFFTSEVGATQALRYVETPGRYDGCADYKKGDRAWAT